MLLAGCIPVVFDRQQIDVYTFHMTSQEISSAHYFIDGKDVLMSHRQGVQKTRDHNARNNLHISIPKILLQVSYSDILSMRRAIRRISWKLQYAIPPRNQNLTYTPPQPDALEIILSNLVSSHLV